MPRPVSPGRRIGFERAAMIAPDVARALRLARRVPGMPVHRRRLRLRGRRLPGNHLGTVTATPQPARLQRGNDALAGTAGLAAQQRRAVAVSDGQARAAVIVRRALGYAISPVPATAERGGQLTGVHLYACQSIDTWRRRSS